MAFNPWPAVDFVQVLFVGFSILFWIALIAVLILLVRFLLIGTKAAQVYLRQHDARPFPPAHSAPAPADPAGHATPAAGPAKPPTPPTPSGAPSGAAAAAPASAPPAAAAPRATSPAAAAPTTTAAPADGARQATAASDAPTVKLPVREEAVPHEAPTVPLQSGAVPLDKAAPRQAAPKRAPRPKKADQ